MATDTIHSVRGTISMCRDRQDPHLPTSDESQSTIACASQVLVIPAILAPDDGSGPPTSAEFHP